MKTVLNWVRNHSLAVWIAIVGSLVALGEISLLAGYLVTLLAVLFYIEDHLRTIKNAVNSNDGK